MKKVGILGGTFNPIHYGHIHLAESAMKAEALDQVLFIPSGISYMKDQKEILPAYHRLEMTRLAVKEYPKFAVSDIEIKKHGNSYSHETICSLKKQYPDVKFYFLTGADTVFTIESWKDPVTIFQTVTILAVYREGASLMALKEKIAYLQDRYEAKISLVSEQQIDISSSGLRAAIKDGRSIQGLVPFAVAEYIEKHHLYE